MIFALTVFAAAWLALCAAGIALSVWAGTEERKNLTGTPSDKRLVAISLESMTMLTIIAVLLAGILAAMIAGGTVWLAGQPPR